MSNKTTMEAEDTVMITELIEQLESIMHEHGDLPVVCTEKMWHITPTPKVEEGITLGNIGREQYLEAKRVELL